MRGSFCGVGSRRLISALLFAALSAASHADYAIVVGVQHYPNAPGYAPLEGPVPDSKALSEVLALRFGFKVRTLLDADATKERILNEIKIAASSIGEDERFVFYFAGHGMMSPPSLMPADAVADDPSGKGEYRTITPDELYAAVRQITPGAGR
ncbi:MAG: Caspase domain protein [Armatimonadetes bacterium OLB18]|nr:MAG: Caspase domain protein [Armatimonadetes bacterium OLB18]